MRAVLLILSILAFSAVADSATQTDWSNGPGVWGPVNEWGSGFHLDSGTEWSEGPGTVSLSWFPSAEHVVSSLCYGAESVDADDINGDGFPDILSAAFSVNEIAWWENADGSGGTWTEHVVDDVLGGAISVRSGDPDGDGQMDIIGASFYDSHVAWWENVDGSGTSWVKHTIGGIGGPYSVCTDDVNGDGFADVLIASSHESSITWWKNVDGSGTVWEENLITGDFPTARSVFCADVNGDGFIDVAGASFSGDRIAWWENVDGSGTSWDEHPVDGSFNGAHCVFAEDMDGDGQMDILGAASVAGDIAWYRNEDGYGTSWSKHVITGSLSGSASVYAEDIDCDGFEDVLGAAFSDDKIIWWRNEDGTGTGWTEFLVDESIDGADAARTSDIDGDGYPDVVAAASDADLLAWWRVVGYGPGALESSVLDTQGLPTWSEIDWTAEEPAGTSVGFQVRSSDSPDIADMGPWSDTLFLPCSLEGILPDGEAYVQYRAVLETTDPNTAPSLMDVTISWITMGVSESAEAEVRGLELLPVAPNPSRGPAALRFRIPEPAAVELSVYDISGRMVSRREDHCPAGVSQLEVSGLVDGVYIARLYCQEMTAMRRFVVLE